MRNSLLRSTLILYKLLDVLLCRDKGSLIINTVVSWCSEQRLWLSLVLFILRRDFLFQNEFSCFNVNTETVVYRLIAIAIEIHLEFMLLNINTFWNCQPQYLTSDLFDETEMIAVKYWSCYPDRSFNSPSKHQITYRRFHYTNYRETCSIPETKYKPMTT